MNESWKSITKDPKELEYLHTVFSNGFFRDALEKMFMKLLAEEERKETSVKQYEDPSWAYSQADRNGYKRALRKMSSLLSIESKESPNHG